MSQIFHEHRHYLIDAQRLEAYSQALGALVRPGDIVLDLGAGSGILGLLACKAGAGCVYAVDDGPALELARRLCQENGYADRVVHIKGNSMEIELPERVDVVVADQVGFGGEYGIIRFFHDARERLLKPGGMLIPGRVDLCLGLASSADTWSQIAFWDTVPAGFTLQAARELATNTRYRIGARSVDVLSEPVVAASLDLSQDTEAPMTLLATLTTERSGTLHGIGGWFVAHLAPHVRMTNLPGVPGAIDREGAFFPLEHSVLLEPGDQVEVKLHIRWADDIYTWQVEVWPEGPRNPAARKAACTRSTWKGMLLTAEDLRHSRPDFMPSLTKRGAARSFVLSLCDGTRAVGEIEQATLQAYPELFRSQSEASAFVAELVQRYTQ